MLQKTQNRRGGFTLVEIMIVVAIIALLASIAVPSALRARKRSQATKSLDIIRQVDSAIDQWTIENNKKKGDAIDVAALAKFVKTNSLLAKQLAAGTDPTDALGHPVAIAALKVDDPLTVDSTTYSDLSDVVATDFWGAYH